MIVRSARRLMLAAGSAALLASMVSNVSAATAPTIVTPDSVAWAKGAGPEAGMMVAVLDGDPSKTGPFTLRIKIPDGGSFAPHMHGGTERVTVISGTLLVGMGDTMDKAQMKALPAGTFAVMPAGVHHFAMAQGTTVVQIAADGPDSTTMIDAHATK